MPFDLISIFAFIVQLLIIWIVILLSERLVAARVGAKRAFALAFLAYFIPPLLFTFVNIAIPFAYLIIPLVVWIILSELLLRDSSFGGRIKIAVVAFVIYLILQFIGLPGLIIGLVG